MRSINVLFGFGNECVSDSIIKELQARNYNVNATSRITKASIKEYIEQTPNLDIVLLKEYLDGSTKYSSAELVDLVDNTFNVRVVIIIEYSHRGREYVKDLYYCGILDAVFSDAKFGARPAELAELIVHGRTRKKAREYYKISDPRPNHEVLNYEDFRDYYSYLVNTQEGINIADRFVTLSRWMTPPQMAKFIVCLPENVKQIIMRYDEFYEITSRLNHMGFLKERYKKSKKKVKAGIDKSIIEEKMNRDACDEIEAEIEISSSQTVLNADEEEFIGDTLGISESYPSKIGRKQKITDIDENIEDDVRTDGVSIRKMRTLPIQDEIANIDNALDSMMSDVGEENYESINKDIEKDAIDLANLSVEELIALLSKSK